MGWTGLVGALAHAPPLLLKLLSVLRDSSPGSPPLEDSPTSPLSFLTGVESSPAILFYILSNMSALQMTVTLLDPESLESKDWVLFTVTLWFPMRDLAQRRC